MTLTDKEKLGIIEGFKKQIELANEVRRREPNIKVRPVKLSFLKEQFSDEYDRIWLSAILDHLGVKHEYI